MIRTALISLTLMAFAPCDAESRTEPPVDPTKGSTTESTTESSTESNAESTEDWLERLQRALDGEPDALRPSESVDANPRWSLLIRGYSMHAAGRPDEAVEAWTDAVEDGSKLAVRALATHHLESGDWREAYAWARLAMEVDAALGDLTMDDLRGSWTLYAAIQAADRLDEAHHAAADALAAARVERYLPILIQPADLAAPETTDVEDLDVVERRRPTYPRAMAENRVPGWTFLILEIRDDGRVGQVVPVGASHDRFARAAVRAIRKWRFNVEHFETPPKMATQLIDFDLRP